MSTGLFTVSVRFPLSHAVVPDEDGATPFSLFSSPPPVWTRRSDLDSSRCGVSETLLSPFLLAERVRGGSRQVRRFPSSFPFFRTRVRETVHQYPVDILLPARPAFILSRFPSRGSPEKRAGQSVAFFSSFPPESRKRVSSPPDRKRRRGPHFFFSYPSRADETTTTRTGLPFLPFPLLRDLTGSVHQRGPLLSLCTWSDSLHLLSPTHVYVRPIQDLPFFSPPPPTGKSGDVISKINLHLLFQALEGN